MKNFLIFLLGAGIGTLATYIAAKKHYEKIISELEEEKDILPDDVRNPDTNEPVGGSAEEHLEYIHNYMKDFLGKDDRAIDFLIAELERRDVSLRYEETYDDDGVNPVIDEECEEFPSDDGCDIYIIGEEVATSPSEGWSHQIVYFYDGDSTFADDDGIVIENWKQHFGNDILNWIEDHNFRKHNLFVRNEALSSDYEIVYKETAYSQEGGEDDDYEPGDMAD